MINKGPLIDAPVHSESEITMTRLTKRLCATAAISALCLVSAPFVGTAENDTGAALAQGLDDGGRARINVAGKMNVLSQTTAASSCLIAVGIDADHERDVLAKAQDDFNRMLWAMEHGDLQVGIPTPESYSKVIVLLSDIHDFWDPMDAAITRVLDGGSSPADFELIAQNSAELLNKTDLMSSTVRNAYANPFDLLLTDALAISFAERQEVFAMKLLREACDIHSGNGTPELMADYNQTMALFGQTLTALHDGYPAAGIHPPATPQIKETLEYAQAEWAVTAPLLATISAAEAASADDVYALVAHIEKLDKIMHTAVVEYLLSAPGANDMIEAPLVAYADDVLMEWVSDPQVIEAVRAQNKLTNGWNVGDKIAMNDQWTAEMAAGGGDLMGKIAATPLSAHLAEVKAATSGVVVQMFVTDALGVKVASSTPTSHFWHGEQSHWKTLFGAEEAPIYVGDAKVQEGSHSYQSRVSLPVIDPDTQERIGVATFGVNVQHMF